MVLISNRIARGVLAVAAGLLLGACGRPLGGTPDSTTDQASPTQATTQPATTSAAAGAGGQTASSGPSDAQCTAAELKGHLEAGDPGAGQRYAKLVLTNSGSAACTLYGYGGMQLVGTDGRPIPTDLRRDLAPGPTTVRLQPGQSAAKNLHWGVVSSGNEPVTGPCEPTAGSVSVIPPNQTAPLSIPWNLGVVCQGGRFDGSAYYLVK